MPIIELPPMDISGRASTQYVERSGGLHLSQITSDILFSMDPKKYGGQGEGKYNNFLAGLIFERALELAWLDKECQYRPEIIRPGEVSLDGITGTPDAYDTNVGCPEEYKFTLKSIRQGIEHKKFWIYWVQLKAYAYMMGCTKGVLRCCFVKGDYGKDNEFELDSMYLFKSYLATWTEFELWENWQMLLTHARNRGWL